ncbi:MAG: TVP38/TMEM64 family protein, partial [Phenylobacterium sp.]|uniref:TVP38/TMEM64 family protein n=1 Tax=Phenylobacterium sp. TaxID=1871053 RepID=UPI001A29665C
AQTLARFSGEGVQRFMRLVGENGFLASLIVRLVPSAPFIVVNMAAGVTPMRALHFVAGTGIGIVPKIVLTAYAGASIVQLMRGEISGHWAQLAAIAALWLAIGWFARRWLQRRGRNGEG